MKDLIEKSLEVLQHKGIILYPTDTIWGIGGDATCKQSIEKVYKIKQRPLAKSLIILVNSPKMLLQYTTDVPQTVLDYLVSPKKPTTIIYEQPRNLPQQIISEDNTIAIRIVQHPFCKGLIDVFNKPLIATSANISGEPSPSNFQTVSEDIKKGVDYIVPLEQARTTGTPSTILHFSEGKITTIRT